MRATSLPEVRELRLFQSMQEKHFEEILSGAYLQKFPAQVQLVTEGDRADFLFIVMEGSVELFATANGRESTMTIVRPVSSFILAAVLKDAVCLMSARTYKKSRVLMIPAQNIRDAFNVDDAFARAIVIELANCYRGVVKEHKNLKLRTAVERLANRLLKIHGDQGAKGSIVLPLDKKTLAAILGMTPENLSRAFGTLKPYGVLVDGSHVTFNDLEALESLAKPFWLIDDRTT